MCSAAPADVQRQLIDSTLAQHFLQRVPVADDGKCLLSALGRRLPNNLTTQQIFAEVWKTAKDAEFGGSNSMSDDFLDEAQKAQLGELDEATAYRLYTCGSFATHQDHMPDSPAADQAARNAMGAFSDTSVIRFAAAAFTCNIYNITSCGADVTLWSCQSGGPAPSSFADLSAALDERAPLAIAVVHVTHDALHYDLVASAAPAAAAAPDDSDLLLVSSDVVIP